MREIPLLEIQVANACNLTCESCSHFSNSGHRGLLRPGEAEEWMRPWRQRVRPAVFRLLGGEPTINPDLAELILLSRATWPDSQIALTTNGFFLHKHPHLPAALEAARVAVLLTVHDPSPDYMAQFWPIHDLLVKWRHHHEFGVAIEESWHRWTRRHRGFGAAVLPFDDGDPRSSWEHCVCRDCRQLYQGKIWKCSPITYLQLQKQAFPTLDPAWDAYLAYRPLEPECTDEELHAFFDRQHENICSMCAARPEPFTKPSPLIPRSQLLGASRRG
jgi:hypothetical protein